MLLIWGVLIFVTYFRVRPMDMLYKCGKAMTRREDELYSRTSYEKSEGPAPVCSVHCLFTQLMASIILWSSSSHPPHSHHRFPMEIERPTPTANSFSCIFGGGYLIERSQIRADHKLEAPGQVIAVAFAQVASATIHRFHTAMLPMP
ncbi:hypothetical protein POM88_054919 [Heracleum sosnowskyi]|uniref:Secreted protein n=1 Tax=Heracleum sosnowskyi TaxID=360622 RepID=A0AAD8GLV2_9APIA|nr:hypothetical protein POM88_054919 [Heracleum sosnowskyi]